MATSVAFSAVQRSLKVRSGGFENFAWLLTVFLWGLWGLRSADAAGGSLNGSSEDRCSAARGAGGRR